MLELRSVPPQSDLPLQGPSAWQAGKALELPQAAEFLRMWPHQAVRPDTLSSEAWRRQRRQFTSTLGRQEPSLQTPNASKSSLTLFPPSSLPPQPSILPSAPAGPAPPRPALSSGSPAAPRHLHLSELPSPCPTGPVRVWLRALQKCPMMQVSFLSKSGTKLGAASTQQACESLPVLAAGVQGQLRLLLPLVFSSLPSKNPEAGMSASSGITSPDRPLSSSRAWSRTQHALRAH